MRVVACVHVGGRGVGGEGGLVGRGVGGGGRIGAEGGWWGGGGLVGRGVGGEGGLVGRGVGWGGGLVGRGDWWGGELVGEEGRRCRGAWGGGGRRTTFSPHSHTNIRIYVIIHILYICYTG